MLLSDARPSAAFRISHHLPGSGEAYHAGLSLRGTNSNRGPQSWFKEQRGCRGSVLDRSRNRISSRQLETEPAN